MANYTLHDDRTIEYQWVYDNLPAGDGLLLDVATPQGYPMPGYAASLGWNVIAVDLNAQNASGGGVEYRRGDLLTMDIAERFDYVLNISSVEHFGLAGRYGVTSPDPDADLSAMAKLRTLMKAGAKMLLTVPVGVDTVVLPLHRVYGAQRLPLLLGGYTVLREAYFAKRDGVDKYAPADKTTALSTRVITRSLKEVAAEHYYALGCFELEVAR